MALTTVVEQAVGLGVTAMHIFEDGIISLPFAAVPLLTVLHGMALVPAFRQTKPSAVRYPAVELLLYLAFAYAGQITFAALASVPLPALASNVQLPTYMAVWLVAHYSPPAMALLSSPPVATLLRAVGPAMGAAGVTRHGIDYVVHRCPHAELHGSAVAALLFAILPNIAGPTLHILMDLVWSARPTAAQQPLPITWMPDYDLVICRRVLVATATYYLVTDPQNYIAPALATFSDGLARAYETTRLQLAHETARLLIYVLLITFEYKQAMTRRAPALLPTTKLRRD